MAEKGIAPHRISPILNHVSARQGTVTGKVYAADLGQNVPLQHRSIVTDRPFALVRHAVALDPSGRDLGECLSLLALLHVSGRISTTADGCAVLPRQLA